MSNLTLRAEQALIGALLADQPLPAELARLEPDGFGHRLLSQVYTAILDLRDQHRGDELTVHVAARVNQPGIDARWLKELRQACPSAAHIASYARMVQASAFRRTIAQHAQRITKTSASGQPDDETGLDTRGMVSALNHQTHAYQAFTVVDERQALHIWQPQAEIAAAAPAPERASREEQVLADLFAHPQNATTVAQFVLPETFTSQLRRDVFTALVTLAVQHDPVDEIIVVWEMQRLRAEAELTGPDGSHRGSDSIDSDLAFVARMATMTVTAGAGITVGHELIVEDARQQLARSAALALGARTAGIDTSVQLGAAGQLDPRLQPPQAIQPGQQPTMEL